MIVFCCFHEDGCELLNSCTKNEERFVAIYGDSFIVRCYVKLFHFFYTFSVLLFMYIVMGSCFNFGVTSPWHAWDHHGYKYDGMSTALVA